MRGASQSPIFLCHAKEDADAARLIYRELREHSLNVWLDEVDLLPGARWREHIPPLIRGASAIVVLFSESSLLKRGYVQRERRLALETAATQEHRIIPVLVDACDVPKEFSSFSPIRWSDPNALLKLIRRVEARS